MNRKSSFRQKGAFTLVELVVVIAIISMLAGLLLPALNSARQRAMVAKCITTIGSLQTALAMYSLDYGLYPPSAQDGAQVSDQHNGNSHHTSFDNGSPNNLVAALTATKLGGPYMEFKGKDLFESGTDNGSMYVLSDPWAQAYIYVCQKDIDREDVNANVGPFHPNATGADKNTNSYNIYSLGPDRQTDDDGNTGGEIGYPSSTDWDESDMFDAVECGDWNDPDIDSDNARYDDINSWDGTRGG